MALKRGVAHSKDFEEGRQLREDDSKQANVINTNSTRKRSSPGKKKKAPHTLLLSCSKEANSTPAFGNEEVSNWLGFGTLLAGLRSTAQEEYSSKIRKHCF